MAYNQSDRSELERRFEALFSQVFQCPWQEHLKAQYHVQADGQNFYIDYVYIGQGRKIAIELDGHGKIKEATDSSQKFHDLLARQNAIMSQGFELYRWGWRHVVSMGSWQARRDLKRIFRGLITPHSAARYPVPITTHSIAPRPQASSSPDVVVPYQYFPSPAPRKPLPIKRIAIALLGLWIVFLLWSNWPTSALPEATKTAPSLSEVVPAAKVPALPQQHPTPTKHTQPFPRRTATQTIHHSNRFKSVPVTPTQPQLPPSEAIAAKTDIPPVPIRERGPIIQPDVSSLQPAAIPDEIVAFNQESGIFHKPNSYWARKCTRNCIYIPKNQAIQLGGRASRADQ